MNTDRDRLAWAEEDWNHLEDKPMKPQPDMAQMQFDDPPTWRDYLPETIRLLASAGAAVGIVVFIAFMREIMK